MNSFTLDLNGYALSNSSINTNAAGVEIIINDSSEEGTGTYAAPSGVTAFQLRNNTKLTLDGAFIAQVLSWAVDAVICSIIFFFCYRTDEQLLRVIKRLFPAVGIAQISHPKWMRNFDRCLKK